MPISSYKPDPCLLEKQIILVTGAGDGIGRNVAKTYASFGATVLLMGRTVSKLEEVYDEIISENHPEPAIIPIDLGNLGMVTLTELSDNIAKNYGRLDSLLHNAGVIGPKTPVEYSDTEEWERVMQINFNGAVLLTRSLLPLLHRSSSASLVFTSSDVGRTPRAYWGAYCVSKYAIEGFALLLADELENTSTIRVNIVNPGATRTKMRATAYPNEDPLTLKTPEELMNLYLYLADPNNKENGQTFNG